MPYSEKIAGYILLFAAGGCFFYFIYGFTYKYTGKQNIENRRPERFSLTCSGKRIFYGFAGGTCAVLSYLFFPSILTVFTVLIFIGLLLLTAVVDQATMEIPNAFVLAALALGIISLFTMPGTSLLSRAVGMFAVSLPLLLLTLAIPGAFGGGDIKLMAACGLFLGTRLILLSFAFAVLTGGLYGIWLLAAKKKNGKEHFAFGPFLCLGMTAALFIGDRVWNWYTGLLYW